MAEKRQMYHLDQGVDKPHPTRREILANLGQKNALERPIVPQNYMFAENNIADIVESIQYNIEDLVIDRNFTRELLELMKCVYKSRPNWDLDIKKLNEIIVRNAVQNLQCGDKLSAYQEKEEAPVLVHSRPNYLYNIKYVPKSKQREHFKTGKTTAQLRSQDRTTTDIAASTILGEEKHPVTLYKTAKQTNNYREFYVHIDSRDRDVFAFPSASRYSIDLLAAAGKASGFVSDLEQRQVRDVVEVSLVEAILPNIFITSLPNYKQPYIFMDIDEFDGELYATSIAGKRLFGKLRFELTSLPVPAITFVNMKCESCIRKWWYKDPRDEYQNNQTPFPKLDKMTINLLDYNGELFNFGQDSFSITNVASVGTKTQITTATSHNLTTNDLIYLKNIFNPPAPLGDGLINNDLTRSQGFLVDAVISGTVFSIDFNSSSLGPFTLDTATVLKAALQHSLTFLVRSIGGS